MTSRVYDSSSFMDCISSPGPWQLISRRALEASFSISEGKGIPVLVLRRWIIRCAALCNRGSLKPDRTTLNSESIANLPCPKDIFAGTGIKLQREISPEVLGAAVTLVKKLKMIINVKMNEKRLDDFEEIMFISFPTNISLT